MSFSALFKLQIKSLQTAGIFLKTLPKNKKTSLDINFILKPYI